MTYFLNETHDPAARSWVESANVPGNDFPIQNLPFGVFDSGKAMTCIGVAIGDRVLDLTSAAEANCIPADRRNHQRSAHGRTAQSINGAWPSSLEHTSSFASFELLKQGSEHRS